MKRITIAALVLASACGGQAEPDEHYPGRCEAGEGVDAAPVSIRGALELIDSLPRPVTVECFVESLERPVAVLGSNDLFSAQPADGADAPRVFAIYGPLTISFVPDGDGSHVVEFSEERPQVMSTKAEIEMPVQGRLDYAAPFERIHSEGGTMCGLCHGGEVADDSIDYAEAYMSEALEPVYHQAVDVGDIADAHGRCDSEATPRRCSIFDSLFYRGDVVEGQFSRRLPTIYD